MTQRLVQIYLLPKAIEIEEYNKKVRRICVLSAFFAIVLVIVVAFVSELIKAVFGIPFQGTFAEDAFLVLVSGVIGLALIGYITHRGNHVMNLRRVNGRYEPDT
jgi:O-antigen/teichoic acid export membrane protein